MNRTPLKNYAPQARRDFIQAMTDRAAYYGLTVNKVEPVVEQGDVAIIAGREYSRTIAGKRKALEDRIQRQGFEPTMEALAYTWFNRLVAIRFMELHDYLDHGYRVLSHPEGKPTPEILQYAEHVELPGLKPETVIDLKLDGNKEAELYRLLLVAQCNALHRVMPFLFEPIDDETELLLPDNLLHSDSLIRTLVSNLDAEDCESVEVLGWLYQFYIAERKDQVMARKSAVPTEDIPAVTQLFTPHWIVRYLVENLLGRLWLLNRPGSRLREQMPYYIEGDPETDFLKITRPEDIRLCDPAVGSGHMLTYAFDLLTLIYQEEGYAPAEIPALILRHNLYGLEICPRAAQLAGLALVFKAREKSRRFFQSEHLVRPHIIELCEVRFAEDELRDYSDALGLGDLFDPPLLKLLHQFEEAKNFGSLIQPCLDERAIANARRAIEAKDLGGQLFLRETHLKVLRVLEQAEALTQRYHVVVANPPYMGGKAMNEALKAFGKENYENGRADLMTMFLDRSFTISKKGAMLAFITLDSWMFLSSFEELRSELIRIGRVSSLIHIGWNCFPHGHLYNRGVGFVFCNVPGGGKGSFINLSNVAATVEKEQLFLQRKHTGECLYAIDPRSFKALPGTPIAYWMSSIAISNFERCISLNQIADGKSGMSSCNSDEFLRKWHEVALSRICFEASTLKTAQESGDRWFRYNKGGGGRKWHGYNDILINWEANGRDIKAFVVNNPRDPDTTHWSRRLFNLDYFFRKGITWSAVTSSRFSSRMISEAGVIPGTGSKTLYDVEAKISPATLLGFLNSTVTSYYLTAFSPTLNFEAGDVGKLPIIALSSDASADISKNVNELISISRIDWDNFETSWDFRDLPLLRPGLKGATLEASWRNWDAHCTAAIRRMQELETENNRLFIAAYGLDGELQPEVPEEQITLARPDARRDIAAFLSYAIGCMMGRYRLDQPGLIYAHSGNRGFDPSQYPTFPADADGIIPLLQTDWGFSDDATHRTHEFLRATFGEAPLTDNLRFIEEALGKDLRKYFLTDFYKDHLQTYKKRPIYWLFSSGKQRAFQCLVYLHRYHVGTLARMRTEYVIPLQGRITARIDQLEGDKVKASSTSHRKQLQKEQDDLKKQQAELLTFEEKLKHAADQKISLDLDDGVKVNYGKFGDLLAESKAITGGKDDE
ncbi:MAG: BREX-1 system adenine-specific DNA-methyltransferase PglX [Candidatus Competibacteraceae bacterium]|nr:BREX-1 system adenine-specific DNA-methyltransferase PglX [Candidatus Competibacteraceae bacterium]